MSGWKCISNVPQELKKYVMVVAPHTSNTDFFIGVAARSILKLDVKFLAKKELFRFPVKGLLRSLGGYPVDRKRQSSMVDQVAEIFKSKPRFSICVTPEGTRSKVAKLRTGFYHIAQEAGVPIVLVGFDYARKLVVVDKPFIPSGNLEKDFEFIRNFFAPVRAKYPEKSLF